MKGKWKIGVAAMCTAVVLTVAFAAAAGSESDPLVTLSYLKNVFTAEIQTMVDQSIAVGQEQNKADLESAIQQWDTEVDQSIQDALSSLMTEEPASFAPVDMGEGQSVTIEAGCEIIVRSGAPVCSVSLIDQTDGAVLAAGKTLQQNHLYLATETGTFSVPTAVITGKVNVGTLNVRAGAGTSYDRLGSLTKDTVVTIVDDSVDGWYMVTGGGLAGYVSSEYITLDPVAVSGPASLLIRGPYTAN